MPSALHIARRLEQDHDTPIHLRGLGWRLVEAVHEALGWHIPDDEKLVRCRGAATSLRHSAAILLHDLTTELRNISGPVLLLGPTAASRSLFGRWSILPARGALLIPLDARDLDQPSATSMHASRGIRWATAGNLRDLYLQHSVESTLGGLPVRLPAPPLAAARYAKHAGDLNDPATLAFLAAARQVGRQDAWPAVREICRPLVCDKQPLAVGMALGLEGWLGLEVSTTDRLMLAARRLLSSFRAASL